MSTPHKCPKCDGVGKLQYDPNYPFAGYSTIAGPWPCPACMGTGILWEITSPPLSKGDEG